MVGKHIVYYKDGSTILIILWFTSIIIASLTLAPGTVANMIDYPSKWASLLIYHRIVYASGDLLCHRKTSRSYVINGDQMPLCSRDTGLYLGVLVSYTILYILELRYPGYYRALMNKLFRSRKLFILLYLTLSMPMAIDFITQYMGLRGCGTVVETMQ